MVASEVKPLPEELAPALAPVSKFAFGIAGGGVGGGAVFLVTLFSIVKGDPPDAIHGLGYLLPMYEVSWSGALLGSLSAGLVSFCAAWFLVFCRNLVVATNGLTHTRQDGMRTRDFLDHT